MKKAKGKRIAKPMAGRLPVYNPPRAEEVKDGGKAGKTSPADLRRFFDPKRKILIDPRRIPETVKAFMNGEYSYRRVTKKGAKGGASDKSRAPDPTEFFLEGLRKEGIFEDSDVREGVKKTSSESVADVAEAFRDYAKLVERNALLPQAHDFLDYAKRFEEAAKRDIEKATGNDSLWCTEHNCPLRKRLFPSHDEALERLRLVGVIAKEMKETAEKEKSGWYIPAAYVEAWSAQLQSFLAIGGNSVGGGGVNDGCAEAKVLKDTLREARKTLNRMWLFGANHTAGDEGYRAYVREWGDEIEAVFKKAEKRIAKLGRDKAK